MRSTLLSAAVVAAFFVVSCNAISFYLPSNGAPFCLGEELDFDQLILGTFSSQSNPISVTVNDANQRTIWTEFKASQGSFAFTTDVMGSYNFCFQQISQATQGYVNPELVTLDLKVGVEAEDWDAIATKEHLSPLELELRKLEDTALALNKHMSYMREREAAMRNTNESTNSRVLWMSLLSLSVLVGLGAWQVFYLKKYFEAKKLI